MFVDVWKRCLLLNDIDVNVKFGNGRGRLNVKRGNGKRRGDVIGWREKNMNDIVFVYLCFFCLF